MSNDTQRYEMEDSIHTSEPPCSIADLIYPQEYLFAAEENAVKLLKAYLISIKAPYQVYQLVEAVQLIEIAHDANGKMAGDWIKTMDEYMAKLRSAYEFVQAHIGQFAAPGGELEPPLFSN